MEENTTSKLALVTTVFMISTAALGYLLVHQTMNTYQLNKVTFICTKIEQTGKNLDDVRCVQYTQQKYYKEAVSLNSFVK